MTDQPGAPVAGARDAWVQRRALAWRIFQTARAQGETERRAVARVAEAIGAPPGWNELNNVVACVNCKQSAKVTALNAIRCDECVALTAGARDARLREAGIQCPTRG